jgi:two-component system, sensor histidine kinase and response regulator
MGGTIDVDSSPGGGSTFRFDIRLRRVLVENEVEASGQAPSTSARRLKVLLAEDDPTNRHVATRMLTRMGHVVDAVEDGALAASAAAASDYDVILMDMMMPEVDGLTATRMIRSGMPPRCHTVIIGLTANALQSDRAACEAAGMNGFVTKPVSMDRLRAALDQAASGAATASARSETPDGMTLDAAFLDALAHEIGPGGVAEMIEIFLSDAPARMTAIQRAMADGDIQTIRREAHALAGAACNVGLARLANAGGALQRASEGSGPDDVSIKTLAAAFSDSLPLAAAWVEAHESLAASDA